MSRKVAPTKADMVKVRTLRPHDTADGMRNPGDQYERARSEADSLAALGVVELL